MNTQSIADWIVEDEDNFPIFEHFFTSVRMLDLSEYPKNFFGPNITFYTITCNATVPVGFSMEDAASDISHRIRNFIINKATRLSIIFAQERDKIADPGEVVSVCLIPLNDIEYIDHISELGILETMSHLSFGGNVASRIIRFFGNPVITEDVSTLLDSTTTVNCSYDVGIEIVAPSNIFLIRDLS